MEHVRTAAFLLHGAFQRLDLAANASYPVQELGLFLDGMAHNETFLSIP
jgi:hypothetical protein